MQIKKSTLYRKTEEQLQNYRAMKARVAILEKDYATIKDVEITETHAEAIEGMYYVKVMNGMPPPSGIGDRTASIAEAWREKYHKDFHRMWRNYVLDRRGLEDELYITRANLQKIDIAIESLLPKEKEVIRLYYVGGVKWEDIGLKLNYDLRHCKRIRDRAVWYMGLSLFTVKVYG